VAISAIGEPGIIFMDEPTTGMDPQSRRHVWSMIQKLKKDRVIILTTHSMEEADVLADRIAIMVSGKLKCIGNSLYLKNKYGDGYRINLMAQSGKVYEVKELVDKYLPGSNLIAEAGNSLVYSVAVNRTDVVAFFEFLENQGSDYLSDWGVSQTTLEEVFLKVTKPAQTGFVKDTSGKEKQKI